jgi:hypothetical protein
MTLYGLRFPVRAFAPLLLLVGCGIVLLAQLWDAVPIATAIAMAAWGTILAAPRRAWAIAATALAYSALGVYAIASAVHLALDASLAWGALVAVDGAAAFMLLYALLRRAGELLAGGLEATRR